MDYRRWRFLKFPRMRMQTGVTRDERDGNKQIAYKRYHLHAENTIEILLGLIQKERAFYTLD